jgi:uncharacterized membrane protein YphA (DoxX/SURF4 family)
MPHLMNIKGYKMILKKIYFLPGWLDPKVRDIIAYLLGLVCALLFVYTAQAKLEDHEQFMKGIAMVEVIGGYAELISWLVPYSELAIALLIAIPWTTKIGLSGFLGMMVIFTVYIFMSVQPGPIRSASCKARGLACE